VSSGDRFCNYCGAPLKPGPWRPTARLLTTLGLVAVLVLATRQVYQGLEAEYGDEAVEASATLPSTTTTAAVLPTSVAALAPTTLPPPTVPPTRPPTPIVKAERIQANRPTPDSTNACQQVDTFSTDNLQDGDFSTAWRVRGTGVGQRIRLRLSAETRVTQVGLVPGWAKVDGCDGADLFRQHRTVARVRWQFDGGAVVEQTLTPTASLQVVPVDVVTRNVTLRIMATNEPNGINMTPISEIRVGGVAVPG
jgi:hypothetical protein